MYIYTQLLPFFKEITPGWRKTQLVNLALLSSAISRRKSLVLAELARAYPIPLERKLPRPKHGLLHRVKRLWRFLDNPRLDEEALMRTLSRLSVSVCRSPGLLLPILIDLTYFEPFAVLSASIPRAGRALPVAWRTFRRDLEGTPEMSQNLLIEDVVRQMLGRYAPGIHKVIVADREFARASFFRALPGLGASFCIRVDAETWVLHESYEGPMGGLGVKRGGRRIWLEGAFYGKEERVPLNLLALWAADQEEPWLIASDLDDPREVERLYRKRMKIEHGFRDWKHHLRLKGTPRVKSAEHLGRLLLGVVSLYWYVCLVGMRLKGRSYEAEVRCRGKLGEFKLALELLELGHEAVERTSVRLVHWAEEQLDGVKFLILFERRQARREAKVLQSG